MSVTMTPTPKVMAPMSALIVDVPRLYVGTPHAYMGVHHAREPMSVNKKPSSTASTAPLASKPPRPLAALITLAANALGESQTSLGDKLGKARKTIGKWMAGRSRPLGSEVAEIARRVVPLDVALARELVESHNASAHGPEWRIDVYTVLPKEPGKIAAHLADAVVCAACDAANATPATMRPAVVAALRRAIELGLDPARLADALEPGAPKGRAKTKV
jgi:hypothetical protein